MMRAQRRPRPGQRCRALVIAIGAALIPALPGTSSETTRFDHFTTAFQLEGAHRLAECEACHVDGIFAGTPTQCEGCHRHASRIRATSKPPRHAQTSTRCESCHQASAWSPVIKVDHFEVFGTCSRCHNGVTATGQFAQHIPTTEECDSCHNTFAWR